MNSKPSSITSFTRQERIGLIALAAMILFSVAIIALGNFFTNSHGSTTNDLYIQEMLIPEPTDTTSHTPSPTTSSHHPKHTKKKHPKAKRPHREASKPQQPSGPSLDRKL